MHPCEPFLIGAPHTCFVAS